jgi:hypothetical protein
MRDAPLNEAASRRCSIGSALLALVTVGRVAITCPALRSAESTADTEGQEQVEGEQRWQR